MLVDRVRLAIMTTLSVMDGEVEFLTLLDKLELSKGNLSSHIRKLEDAGLLEVKKEFVNRKSKTTYTCSKEGKGELKRYLAALNNLLTELK